MDEAQKSDTNNESTKHYIENSRLKKGHNDKVTYLWSSVTQWQSNISVVICDTDIPQQSTTSHIDYHNIS
jgi:hypothetical protein